MRTPRWTCVSEGYPLRRLLMVSKGNVFVVVFELHDAPPLVNEITWHVRLAPTRKTRSFATGFGETGYWVTEGAASIGFLAI